MADNMYSAEEAARILGLQVRTVRNYVRDGRLPGVRIGKQYRIARADLEAFTAGTQAREAFVGVQADAATPPRPPISAEVSSVVQIDGIGQSSRDRLERTLDAATLTARSGGSQLRIEPLYDPERHRLKLIIVGSVAEAAEVLRVVELFALDGD